MTFEFATATRILFGAGASCEVRPAAIALGGCALVVTGASEASLERALRLVGSLLFAPVPVEGEPTIDMVRAGTATARRFGCDVVIAIGGGSAIDAGKAIAAMLANPGDPLDYLEVIGRGQPLANPSAPFIAVPTTAGTGSEVTRNAVLASPEHRVKASLRGAGMLPRLAVVDPELTLELPPAITASTGLDALTQLIEPYVSAKANPLTDALCVDGIRRVARALPRVWANPSDLEARTEMCLGSLYGGLALANAGLGAVHGFAAPIGGMFPAPHGAVCAAVLPHAMAVNLDALRRREPESRALARYREIAALVTGQPEAAAEDGVAWVAGLCRRLKVPPLRSYGVGIADTEALVEKAAQASSMKANPLRLSPAELRDIVTRAL